VVTSKLEPLKVLSLFSGCGGMDLGFEGNFMALSRSINPKLNPNFIAQKLNKDWVLLQKTRFQTVFANDILLEAKNAWHNYFVVKRQNCAQFYLQSIVDLVQKQQNGEQIFPSKVDLVIGGFPCQDFSVAGKRKGLSSNKDHNGQLLQANTATIQTRGQLYMWMKKVIEITKPYVFIAENVKGLTNLANIKDVIAQDFALANDNGYLVLEPQILQAANFGVSQSRERVFFIGIKKSALNAKALQNLSQKQITPKYNPYPNTTHYYKNKANGLKHFVQLKQVFKDLKEPQLSDDLSQKYYSKAKFMGRHCQGQIEIKLTDISPTIRAEHHGNIEFRRLSAQNGGKIHFELAQNLSERRLTVRECALIQTFPPDYDFVLAHPTKKGAFLVSPSKAYKIIGNAVPPLMAYHLAKRLEDLWDLYFK